jgi:hypothetical protein
MPRPRLRLRLPLGPLPLRRRRRHEDPSVDRHNWRVNRHDAVAVGIVSAAGSFLAVFVTRLGGSAFEVSLLTVIPALSGFLLAIPAGQILQSRARIVPWYATARMLNNLSYGAIALAAALVPPDLVVPCILLVWGLGAVPWSLSTVAFPVVMDGAAGSWGRYEFMGQRWTITGITSAISTVVIGILLARIAFPDNYGLVMVTATIAGLFDFWYSNQYRVPDADPQHHGHGWLVSRIRTLADLVRAEPAFVRFTLRELLFVSGTLLVVPLIPLYYVRVVDAPDAWIGIIASCHTVSLLLGYHVWRRRSAKVGGRNVLLLALPGLALVPTVLSFAHQLPVVAAAAGLGGFFTAGVDLVLFDELMRTVPRRSAVALTSVHAASINGVSVVAPLTGAWLASTIGIEGALRMGTVLSLMGFGLFALDLLRRPRPAPA